MAQPQYETPGVSLKDRQVNDLLFHDGRPVLLVFPRKRQKLTKDCVYYVKEAFTYAETRLSADGRLWADVHYRADGRCRPVEVSEHRLEQIEAWIEDMEVVGDGEDNWQSASKMPKLATRLRFRVLQRSDTSNHLVPQRYYVEVLPDEPGEAPAAGFTVNDETSIHQWMTQTAPRL